MPHVHQKSSTSIAGTLLESLRWTLLSRTEGVLHHKVIWIWPAFVGEGIWQSWSKCQEVRELSEKILSGKTAYRSLGPTLMFSSLVVADLLYCYVGVFRFLATSVHDIDKRFTMCRSGQCQCSEVVSLCPLLAFCSVWQLQTAGLSVNSVSSAHVCWVSALCSLAIISFPHE